MKQITAIIMILISLVLARPAAAHTELVGSEPAPGAQLAQSPAEIRLTFSEPVAPNSQIVLLTEDFQSIEGLVPQFNPAQPEQVYTPVPALEPGVYTVQWSAASADGHEVTGSYSFSVGLVTQGAATPPPAETAATPASSGQSSGSAWWLAIIGLIAVGVPIVLLAVRRAGRG